MKRVAFVQQSSKSGHTAELGVVSLGDLRLRIQYASPLPFSTSEYGKTQDTMLHFAMGPLG